MVDLRKYFKINHISKNEKFLHIDLYKKINTINDNDLINYPIYSLCCFIFDELDEYLDNLKISVWNIAKDIYGNDNKEVFDNFNVSKDEFLKINRGNFNIENFKNLFSISTSNRNFRDHIPQNVRDEVWRRDQGRCIECGSKEFLEFDHIIPISKGGSNTTRNIQLLCQTCNRKKSNKIG